VVQDLHVIPLTSDVGSAVQMKAVAGHSSNHCCCGSSRRWVCVAAAVAVMVSCMILSALCYWPVMQDEAAFETGLLDVVSTRAATQQAHHGSSSSSSSSSSSTGRCNVLNAQSEGLAAAAAAAADSEVAAVAQTSGVLPRPTAVHRLVTHKRHITSCGLGGTHCQMCCPVWSLP